MESLENLLVRTLMMRIWELEEAVHFLENKVLELKELSEELLEQNEVNKSFHVEDLTPKIPEVNWHFRTQEK